MAVSIRTNHQWRDILTWWDLTDKERAEFDYLEDGEGEFVRYRGHVHYMGNFMRIDDQANMPGWHGAEGDSYFSGTLVRLSDDGERCVMGTYMS